MNRDSISAVIPARDATKFLESIETAVTTNLRGGDEIVLVNDDSSIEQKKMLSAWAEREPRLRIIQGKELGLISALNLGISESSNNWIARFDVDDLYPVDRIEKQRALISEKAVAIFSDYSFRSANGDFLGRMPSAVYSDAVSISLINGRRTPHPAALFNKSAYLAAGKYREEDFLVEDLSLWLRLSRLGEFVSVPENLLNYTLHGNSITLSNREAMAKNRKSLLQNISIHQESISRMDSSIDEVLEGYDKLKFGKLRTLLLLGEIRSLGKYQKIPQNLKDKIASREFLLILLNSATPEVANFAYSTIRRRRLRNRIAN